MTLLPRCYLLLLMASATCNCTVDTAGTGGETTGPSGGTATSGGSPGSGNAAGLGGSVVGGSTGGTILTGGTTTGGTGGSSVGGTATSGGSSAGGTTSGGSGGSSCVCTKTVAWEAGVTLEPPDGPLLPGEDCVTYSGRTYQVSGTGQVWDFNAECPPQGTRPAWCEQGQYVYTLCD